MDKAHRDKRSLTSEGPSGLKELNCRRPVGHEMLHVYLPNSMCVSCVDTVFNLLTLYVPLFSKRERKTPNIINYLAKP